MSVQIQMGSAVVTVDEESIPFIAAYKWSAGSVKPRVLGIVNGVQVALHRFLTSAPDGMDVDHINGNPLDNRMANLHICTHAENSRNRKMHASNKCGVKGVYKERATKTKPYRAEIKFEGRKIRLGSFLTADEAGLAYQAASAKYHGEFARRP